MRKIETTNPKPAPAAKSGWEMFEHWVYCPDNGKCQCGKK